MVVGEPAKCPDRLSRRPHRCGECQERPTSGIGSWTFRCVGAGQDSQHGRSQDGNVAEALFEPPGSTAAQVQGYPDGCRCAGHCRIAEG